MRHILAIATLAALAGCTAAQQATAYADGQLFCADGPTVVAIIDTTGAPVMAKGASAMFVKAACAAINAVAVPVVPPATAVPTAAIVPPVA